MVGSELESSWGLLRPVEQKCGVLEPAGKAVRMKTWWWLEALWVTGPGASEMPGEGSAVPSDLRAALAQWLWSVPAPFLRQSAAQSAGFAQDTPPLGHLLFRDCW